MRILLLALITACGKPPPDPPDPPPPDAARFAPDPGASPSLRLEGTFDGDRLTVEVWADELGPVFGIAGHLAFDPSHLSVAQAELAPDALPDAATLLTSESDRVIFGSARRGAALGDAMLEGPVRLATVRFDVLAAKDSRLDIARAMVRRADGSFVAASFLGAGVHTPGGAP